ncbi:MAG: EAL domain-containing protein [Candidatus Aminicenantes bacterium]|nr:EAL domain-containing protein [Candidatus Aminicenantes bacterium]
MRGGQRRKTIPSVASNRRPESILRAVGYAAERFLRAASWETHIQEVIEGLGLAADVSRVCIFRNHYDAEGRLLTSRVREWTAPGVAPQIANPRLQGIPLEAAGFGRWIRQFQKDESVYGLVKDFPETERPLLESQGIRSLLAAPVFVAKQLWGFIGFDECRRERIWDPAEVDFLKAAANILGAAVESQKVKASLEASESELRALFEAMNDVIIVVNREGRFLQVAPTNPDLLYLPAEDLAGKTLHDVFPPDQADRFLGYVRRTLETRKPVEAEYTLPVGKERRPAEFAAALRPMAGDRALLVARDVTAAKRAAAALRRSEENYRGLFENMIEGVYQTAPDGRILAANMALVRMLGYDSEAELKATLSVDAYVDPRQRELWAERLNREGEIRNFESTFRRKDGTVIQALENARVVRDPEGDLLYYEGTLTDITERKNLEAQLRVLANRDSLTGLFNRRRFHEELEMQISQASRYDLRAALLWLDLDHFKTINDSYGHKAGDELLMSVARLLQEQVRQSDLLSRLGGDEFAIFMPHADLGMAEAAAARILKTVRDGKFELEDRTIRLTASIGIALYPEHGVTADKLLTHADLAMYRAKEEGRDRFGRETHEEEQLKTQSSRAAWSRMVREGIEEGRFLLRAQPILDLRRRDIVQHELLLRWAADDGEVVSAESFLETFLNLDLIQEIDRWVARQALQLLERLKRAGSETLVSFNVSSKALADGELAGILETGLKTLDPSRLVVEISERSTVSQFPQAHHFFSFLKRMGCRCALDNFGAGLTSLQQLKLLDLDFLKIDNSLILDLPQRRVHQQLVRAMVQLAHSLDFRVIAEGVNEEYSLELLGELEVDMAQGHVVGEPGSLEHIR